LRFFPLISVLFACNTSTGESEDLPTTQEIEAAISAANYFEVAEECAFVDNCWCGAVANIEELDALQSLIMKWKQDTDNAESCAESDCGPFLSPECVDAVCVALSDE